MSNGEYRVNFGNGQVHHVESKAAGFRYLKMLADGNWGSGYAFVQRYAGEGEWVKVKAPS
jgi:hypothetical protein